MSGGGANANFENAKVKIAKRPRLKKPQRTVNVIKAMMKGLALPGKKMNSEDSMIFEDLAGALAIAKRKL